MKYNENKSSDVILFKLHPTMNVFQVSFQAITLQKQGVQKMLVHRCFIVVTLKQY